MKSPCCGLHLFNIGTILLLFRDCIIVGLPDVIALLQSVVATYWTRVPHFIWLSN